MVRTFADALMSTEAGAFRSVEQGQFGDERITHRNGYRPRERDTGRALSKPALISVVATAHLAGVRARRVEAR